MTKKRWFKYLAAFYLIGIVAAIAQAFWSVKAIDAYALAAIGDGVPANAELVDAMGRIDVGRDVSAVGTVASRHVVNGTPQLLLRLAGDRAGGQFVSVLGNGLGTICVGDAIAVRGSFQNLTRMGSTVFVTSGSDVHTLPMHGGHIYALNFLRLLTHTCDSGSASDEGTGITVEFHDAYYRVRFNVPGLPGLK